MVQTFGLSVCLKKYPRHEPGTYGSRLTSTGLPCRQDINRCAGGGDDNDKGSIDGVPGGASRMLGTTSVSLLALGWATRYFGRC